jgi:hypothetical protein
MYFLIEPDTNVITHTMESKANNKILTIIPSPDEVIINPHLEDVLRHIATFLDFHSLRQFRLVSRDWNTASLPILMKKGNYNLTHPCHRNEREDLYQGAIHYSSWKISHSVYTSAKLLLHGNEMWENVSSLTIHQRIPLSREFLRWAWETIESRCPNLRDLIVIFQSVEDSELRSTTVVSDYEQAIQGQPNASFPKISKLTNLSSIQFKGIHDKLTAYFAQILLQACTNLRHLSFCPIAEPTNVKLDTEAFSIFEYLHLNPSLLRNLQSFIFTIGRYSSDDENVEGQLNPFNFFRKQSEFNTLIIQKPSLLPFQFSNNLNTLYWDSPFHLDGQLLPGVLTASIASSLVQLSLTGNVYRLGKRAEERWNALCRDRICFPNFPRLRALKLGLHPAHSLSVPELVDSAPNLSVLELKELKGNASDPRNELSSVYWRATAHDESYSNPDHRQLRVFCTDIPGWNLTDAGDIFSKFPNLVELRLGRVEGVGLEQFLRLVQSTTHPNDAKLQRLSWSSSEKFTLEELFRHLVRLPGRLPALNSYSLGWQGTYYIDCENVTWPDSIQDMETLANSLLSLPSKSKSALVISLLFKSLCCQCVSKEESPADDCKQCYLHHFIRSHNLPIRIHSVHEIKEIERRYKWNHRFACNWVYK